MNKPKPKAAQKSLLSYFGRRTLIVCIVILIGLIAMTMSMKISNCSVLVGDAMSARADYILTGTQESKDALSRFFTQEYLASGAIEEERNRYDSYNISNYIDLPSTGWIWVWPWSSSASVRVYDKVTSIMGVAITDGETNENGDTTAVAPTPPRWQTGTYSVRVKRVHGQWLVDSIKLIKLDEQEAAPTPTPAAEPTATPGA